jgi:hypothetical protein
MSTLYDLTLAVAAQLRARKFPPQVHYGPLRAQRQDFQSLIIFERDREAGDQIVEPSGANQRNPEAYMNRKVSGVVHVFARSSKPGAMQHHHEGECDRLCDGVLSALYRVSRERKLPVEITESRMLSAEDCKDFLHVVEQWPGAVTRIRFKLRELVRDVDYLGEGAATGVVFAVHAPLVTSDEYPDYNPVDDVP